MEAIDELAQLYESMRQASALLTYDVAYKDDLEEQSTWYRRPSTFLNVIALGNVGVGKSAVLNSLIGHPVLPTGENGATQAPISIDLNRDASLSTKSIVLQSDNQQVSQVSASALRHSLQDRLSKSSSGKGNDEICLKLHTSTAPPLKLIDLPGFDQCTMYDSMISSYCQHNDDAILLVIIPAAQAPEISLSRALRVAKDKDLDGTRTIGVINKIDQAAKEPKIRAAVEALLLNQGPESTYGVTWVALISQSISIASAQSQIAGSENSLETTWRAESDTLKSILNVTPEKKLGRVALVDALAKKIRNRMKVRLLRLLPSLKWKSQVDQDESVNFGESMGNESAEGTRDVALRFWSELNLKFEQLLGNDETFVYIVQKILGKETLYSWEWQESLEAAGTQLIPSFAHGIFIVRGLEVGSFYEFNRGCVPPNGPFDLDFLRVVMVYDKTESFVSLRFPTTYSMIAYFKLDIGGGDEDFTLECLSKSPFFKGRLGIGDGEQYPALDMQWEMKWNLTDGGLIRKIPKYEFDEQSSTLRFWTLHLPDNDVLGADELSSEEDSEIITKEIIPRAITSKEIDWEEEMSGMKGELAQAKQRLEETIQMNQRLKEEMTQMQERHSQELAQLERSNARKKRENEQEEVVKVKKGRT